MINGRRGGPPIKVPFAIRTSDPTLSAFFGEVRRAIQGLRDSIPQMPNRRGNGGGSDEHPFKIVVEGSSLSVGFGMLYASRIFDDDDAKPYQCPEPVGINVNGNNLRNLPGGGTVGTITVSASTAYGVWIELSWSITGNYDKTAGTSGDFTNWTHQSFTLGAEVVVSTTATSSSGASTLMAAASGKSYLYIGKATTDGSGGAEILQYLRSDLVLPAIALPNRIVSTDSGNLIYIGGDGALMVDP
jgi:hypothetical protein